VRLWALAVLAATVGACAALSGLDSLSSGDCSTSGAVCDATVDTAGAETGPLPEAGDDASEDTYVPPGDEGGNDAPVDVDAAVAAEAGCPAGFLACEGIGCVDPSSTASCGACGHACASGAICSAGACVSGQAEAGPEGGGDAASDACVDGSCACSSGYTNCGGVCVDEQTNSAHCGGCGTACSGGMTCQSGGCACPPGSHTCSGTCVSSTSLSSCGTSCSACPSPPTNGTETCDGTSCGFSCSGGQSPCSGACVNEQTDVNHCGGCSIACASGSTCTNGTCVSPDGGLACTGCSTAGCCGTSCKVSHSNGTGQTYYDCNATGTYNQTTATEACAAYTGSSSACTVQQTALNPVCPGINAMCGTSGGTCHCWLYTALYLGRQGTVQTPATGCTVGCSLSTDPSWN
jgi:hypothetical protein